jgi:hypothetical protein
MAEDSGEIPPALVNQPDIPLYLCDITHAFKILSPQRNIGMEVCPITLSDIKAYIDLFGEPLLGRELFVNLLSQVDQTFLEKSRNVRRPS